MSKPLTIVVYSMNGVGHVYACVGLAEKLKARGHRIILVVGGTWKGKIEHYGFEHYFREEKKSFNSSPEDREKNPGDKLSENFKRIGICAAGNSYDKMSRLVEFMFGKFQTKDSFFELENDLREVIELYRPDMFVVDSFHLPVAIGHSGKPWIRIVSTHPLFFERFENIPPSCSGFPMANGDQSEWPQFHKLNRRFHYSDIFAQVQQDLGYEPYPDTIKFPPTYALSIYGYPDELDYRRDVKYPDNWINVETFMRDNRFEPFQMPQSLIDASEKYPGKLILLGFGSLVSIDVDLMKRFVRILSRTKHRYIVAKGSKHEEFELGENMWGDRFVPQTGILPLVDLVITHGGNNTVTETLAHGKPMIVCPIFLDQFDNAQRVVECGFGRRLDPYQFEDHQLTDAIEQLLNEDETLKKRLKKMSKRIMGIEDRFKEAVDRIEALCLD